MRHTHEIGENNCLTEGACGACGLQAAADTRLQIRHMSVRSVGLDEFLLPSTWILSRDPPPTFRSEQ
ncbi:hypothetical protein Q5P01_009402 [Channa striata]|uniref:Uncharacterized protein n=1 Tax=Channa striata TaxID=64152 RepID=A0AA88N5U1_CHASR|nr:hypothetical protein Q5P01_009402 [Channa striata]